MPAPVQLGQHAPPRHVIAHLSDPHLLAHGVRQYGAVDTEAGLAAALARLRRLDPPPQALVFTGDLADLAEPAAYDRLRKVVEPVAGELGAEVVWVMGNHDDRAAFSEILHAQPPAHPQATQDRVHVVDGLRVVSLDTTVPGYHHGEVTPEQLTWLAGVLATPAPHGTVLALHHPPIPVPMLRGAEVIELADQHALEAVVRGSDVRLVIGGHFHLTSWSTFAGVPVSVASATCYTSDPAPRHGLVAGVDGHQALTVLHLYDDRVVHTVVPVAAAPVVSGYDDDVIARIEAMSPEERREQVSRADSPLNAATEDHAAASVDP